MVLIISDLTLIVTIIDDMSADSTDLETVPTQCRLQAFFQAQAWDRCWIQSYTSCGLEGMHGAAIAS